MNIHYVYKMNKITFKNLVLTFLIHIESVNYFKHLWIIPVECLPVEEKTYYRMFHSSSLSQKRSLIIYKQVEQIYKTGVWLSNINIK